MANLETVKIACTGAEDVALDDLKPMQGNLKTMSKATLEKFEKEILRHGFSEPVSVWVEDGIYHILNGHQRVTALKSLRSQGYKTPEKVPVSIVTAKNKKEAYEKILALTSQYGEMDFNSLKGYLDEFDIDLEFVNDHLHFADLGDLNLLEVNTHIRKKSDEELAVTYDPLGIRKLEVILTDADYEKVIARLEQIMKENSLESYTAAIVWLCEK